MPNKPDNLESLREDFQSKGQRQIAEHSQRFFKTGKGEYAEGDLFLGIRVPIIRKVVKQHKDLDLKSIQILICSKWHEERLLGLLFLVQAYKQKAADHKKIYKIYLKHFKYINNWDLVDTTAEHIVGAYLYENIQERDHLFKWARSKHLWTRRISMMSTFYFIRQKRYEETLSIAESLLHDKHDLIHKAVGWLLREVGNRDRKCEEQFLQKHYRDMPRTMLRYAIERFPETRRQQYLKGKV